MTALWTSGDAERAAGGKATRAFEATGVSIDTRTLVPGDLFVALRGDHRDGHAFAAAALDKGAAAAVVARVPDGVAKDAPLLVVGDTQAALEALGRAARMRSTAKILAVTGSAGKTTTKEMLRLALGALGETAASAASYNNHWGVPLSLARMSRGAHFGVFEVGMNHAGEIRALVSMIRPHVALITTIAPAHLAQFGSLDAIADAKAEIFEGLAADGTAIVPAGLAQSARLIRAANRAGAARVMRFGEDGDVEGRLLSCTMDARGMRVEAEILGRALSFAVGAAGRHIAMNAVAALLAVAAAGGDVARAARALAGFAALKGRGARFTLGLDGGTAEIIDESYNANPASMAAALALLGAAKPGAGGRRIAALGDMLELGAQGAALHAGIARDVAAARADLVYACGPLMKALWEALPPACRAQYGAAAADIAENLAAALRPGDVVLVKGSFGSRMSVVIDALKARGAVAAA